MELKNRMIMGAMHLAYTPDGVATDRLIDFYSLRARGGVGLIVVGGCRIDDVGGARDMLGIHDDRCFQGLKKLTRAVNKNGAKIAVQLYHAGRYARASSMGGQSPVSASAIRSKLTGETPKALDLDEIHTIQVRFAEAAKRAVNSGFDAVEILGSAGYLISQFLSPITNLRQDDYGGSLTHRMRFGVEVAQKVRNAVGPDYPVLMRIAGNEFIEGGNTNQEAKIFGAALEEAGVDLLNVTGGWHETRIPQLTAFVPKRAFSYLAKGVKSAVSIPVAASNRINDPHIGEEILRNDEADLVTMARALIADPELPNKAYQGKTDRIYHCVACNQGCLDHIFKPVKSRPVTCLVNPRAGREKELPVVPASKSKTVLVIGGGPAGMKAACTLAERGHKVTLVEKNDQLGGQLLLNRHIFGRKELVVAIADMFTHLKALNTEIRLGKEASAAWIREISPDAVVIATGAKPVDLDIPGKDRPNVVQAWDLLAGKADAGKTAIVIGGNAVGLETALYLAEQGSLCPEVLHFLFTNRAETIETLQSLLDSGRRKVQVVEMATRVGQDIGPSTRWTVLAELSRFGVGLLKGTKAVKITDSGLEIEKKGRTMALEADTIVLATGSTAENTLAGEIEAWAPEALTIGDAKDPRNALDAIREGFMAGLKI